MFTYALLTGLKQHAADANKDKTITVSELQGYVIDQGEILEMTWWCIEWAQQTLQGKLCDLDT